MINLFIDWHEELGHNNIYIHAYSENPNNTIYFNSNLDDIVSLIEDGFFSWENNDQFVWYLKNCDILPDDNIKVRNHE